MTNWMPYFQGAFWSSIFLLAAGRMVYCRGKKSGYDRGFIAARLKYEIPRNSHGRFVKKG